MMMLGALDIYLRYPPDHRPVANMGSVFHGWLMETAAADFAERVHQQGLKPYSQYITYSKGEAVWRIRTLDADAYRHIIQALQEACPRTISIKSKGIEYEVTDIKEAAGYASYKDLADRYYLEKPVRRTLVFRTRTPVSFRSDNQYQIFPQEFHIFQNLINRWNAFADTISLDDRDTILALDNNSRISRYRLESTSFNLEGIRIPSFRGSWEMKLAGPDALARLGGMLAHYAQYAGLGIKTALGMGGIKSEDTDFFCRRD